MKQLLVLTTVLLLINCKVHSQSTSNYKPGNKEITLEEIYKVLFNNKTYILVGSVPNIDGPEE